jgi:hypothetical protein
MADRESGGCCRCCFSFIITLGLTSLFMWLSLRADNPKITIKYFYLPALNKTFNNRTTNKTLIIELKLDNGNKDKGIYYDAINLNFSDNPNRSLSHLMGNYTIPAFRQGQNKKAKRIVAVEVNRTMATLAAFPNGSAVFRVDMATAVRFRIMFWKTKKHRLMLGASVGVDDQGGGNFNKKKGIRLKSGAPEHGGCCAQMGLLVGLMVLVLINFR